MRRALLGMAFAVLAATQAMSGDEKPPIASAPSTRAIVREAVAIGADVPAELRVTPFPRTAEGADVEFAALGGNDGKPLVAFFWSTRCPVCRRYAEVVKALAKSYEGKIRVAFVFPNSVESDADVKATLDGGQVAGAVALARDADTVARLAISVTPTALVVDGGGVLRYRGPVDDDRRNRRRDSSPLLAAALDAVLAGKPVENAEPRAFGSSVRFTSSSRSTR